MSIVLSVLVAARVAGRYQPSVDVTQPIASTAFGAIATVIPVFFVAATFLNVSDWLATFVEPLVSAKDVDLLTVAIDTIRTSNLFGPNNPATASVTAEAFRAIMPLEQVTTAQRVSEVLPQLKDATWRLSAARYKLSSGHPMTPLIKDCRDNIRSLAASYDHALRPAPETNLIIPLFFYVYMLIAIIAEFSALRGAFLPSNHTLFVVVATFGFQIVLTGYIILAPLIARVARTPIGSRMGVIAAVLIVTNTAVAVSVVLLGYSLVTAIRIQ